MLQSKKRDVGDQYPRMIFTRKYYLCTNFYMQKLSTNTSALHLHDVTDQPTILCDHNTSKQKAILGNNGEFSIQWLFSIAWCVQNLKWCVRNKIMYGLFWIIIFGHWWSSSATILLRIVFLMKIIGKAPHSWQFFLQCLWNSLYIRIKISWTKLHAKVKRSATWSTAQLLYDKSIQHAYC